jgi:hypothetical protein
MEKVLEILNEIAAESSTKGKEELLKKYLPENILLQRVATYALDQGKSYNVTELVETEERVFGSVFNYLDYLADKRGATDQEVNTLSAMCRTEAEWEIVTRIIKKDLRIGCGAKSFNKVIPDLIYQVPYQRYSSFKAIEKIDFEKDKVIAQLKMDGRFAYMLPPATHYYPFVSRQGLKYSMGDALVGEDYDWVRLMERDLGEPVVLQGEKLVFDYETGAYCSRAVGNGLINEHIAGGKDVSDRIRYVVWGFTTLKDFLRKKSDMTYWDCLSAMENAYEAVGQGSRIILTKTEMVGSYAEAMEFYSRARSRKEEGAMIKAANKLKWRDCSSGDKYGVKLKPEAEAEFEIVDAYPGEKGKKYENMLGGLTIKTSCEGILSNVGSGFSDEQRGLGVDWWKEKIGKIVTCKFTEVVTDKTSRKTMCLSHPRFVEDRFTEKDEADTLRYCLEQLQSA